MVCTKQEHVYTVIWHALFFPAKKYGTGQVDGQMDGWVGGWMDGWMVDPG